MDSSLGQSHNASSSSCIPQPQSLPQPQLLSESDTEEAVDESTGTKRGRGKGGSVVWQYSKKIKKEVDGGEDKILGVCNYCKIEISAHPKKHDTTVISNHLKKCKDGPFYKRSDKSQPVLTNETMGSALVPHTFNQKRLEDKVVRMVIKDEIPFRVVEGEGFREMMVEAQPLFKMINRKEVGTGVMELFYTEKAKIMSVMGDRRVSITIDTWTSIQNINYMVVMAHFMDSDWILHKRIIAFTKITSHKGEDIGSVLEVILNSWGIAKIFSITVDNASTNDSVIEYMKKRLEEKGNLSTNGKYLHLRCACHILNLIVKSGLKSLASSIDGIRNCVKYLYSSSSGLDKFRDFAILFNMDKNAIVPMDVSTRWNTTYKMLEVAYKYKKVFTRMVEESKPFCDYFNEKEKDPSDKKKLVKRVGPLTEVDWERALAFVHFLKKFYTSILNLSASKLVTSTLLWEEIVSLQMEIDEKMKDSSNTILQSVATQMKKKFDKYWGKFDDMNKLIFLGQVLDPCLKLQVLTLSFRELGHDQWKVEDMIMKIKRCLLELYDEYRGACTIGPAREVAPQSDTSLLLACRGNEHKMKLIEIVMQQRKEQQLQEISNEVDKYFASPFENPLDLNFNLLAWWKGNTTNYPILAKIANDIFSIPTSTVASENAFSLGRRIVDPFRASLSPKMVESLVCTSDWLKADRFNFYNEPSDEEVQFFKEMEEVETRTTALQSYLIMSHPPSASLI